MLNDDNQSSSNSNPITDVNLPNAILSNGIVIDTTATSDCQATDKGKNSIISVELYRFYTVYFYALAKIPHLKVFFQIFFLKL